MTPNTDAADVPDEWPTCAPEQVEVMLLGTYHMASPGNDEINVDADDVLEADRQVELRDLTDRLAEWNPDRIAVEWPADWQSGVNSLYDEYRTGKRSYDEFAEIEAEEFFGVEADVGCRNETIQVGFRLADRLDHDRIAAIDEHPSKPDADPFEERDLDSVRKTEVDLPTPEAMQRESDERLASSSIPEFLAWVNDESNLRQNHDLMFDRGIRSADERFGSPVTLTHWYDRNIRMVHHLWRTMHSDDDRILLLVGSGHVRVLRHLLTEAPMFCPVSPLPYLD